MTGMTKKVLAAVSVATAIFATQAWADSGSGVPGSVDDPVVTKSYVDQQIQAYLGGGAMTGGGSTLQVVELTRGQTLYGFEGTEFIVRTGRVVTVAGDNGDGLTDLTEGEDLRSGEEAEHDHLLLVPRSDNRGLRLDRKYDGTAYVIVRGKYEIR